MIRMIDCTLTLPLADGEPDPDALIRFCLGLATIGVDLIEISLPVWSLIRKPLLEKDISLPLLIRVDHPSEGSALTDGCRLVCRDDGSDRPLLQLEHRVNDAREISGLIKINPAGSHRITGLPDLIQHDYRQTFQRMLQHFGVARTVFCPTDSHRCATALAVEWLIGGGRWVAASLNGAGGLAATETVLMAMRVIARQRPNCDLSSLPELAASYEKLFGVRVPDKAPVIGRRIFEVEAGIHAEALAKGTHIYEPYHPNITGNARRLVVGKHSGQKAIGLKLAELGLNLAKDKLPFLLRNVQAFSLKAGRSLTDCEFIDLAKEVIEHDGSSSASG